MAHFSSNFWVSGGPFLRNLGASHCSCETQVPCLKARAINSGPTHQPIAETSELNSCGWVFEKLSLDICCKLIPLII